MTAIDERTRLNLEPGETDHNAAWLSLAIVWPNHGVVEIGPITDDNLPMALVVGNLINANPALRNYICDRLAELPPVAGIRVLPLAALRDEVEMTMRHGVHPCSREPEQ